MVHDAEQGQECVAAVTVAEQVTARTVPALERKVDDAVERKPQVVDFVMSHVQVVDSAGLAWLLSILGRLETLNIKMRIVAPSPLMADVLLATRLDSRFVVETSQPAASGSAGGEGDRGG